MKAEELMIGDLVRVSEEDICINKGSIVKVLSIDSEDSLEKYGLKGAAHCEIVSGISRGGVWCAYLEPIPITAEILEKNGFNIENNNELTYSVWCDGEMHISIWYGKHFIEDLYISYVHQLQHALRLCGIEKEIVI